MMLDKYAKNSTNVNPVAMMCGNDNRFKKKNLSIFVSMIFILSGHYI